MIWFTCAFLWTLAGSTEIYNNVALQSRSTQSSTDSLSSTINAIDGNLDPNFWQGSCFSTKFEASPWLRVDLLATHKISHIIITNRGDCCANYIDGAEILVGDSLDNNGNNNQKCATVSSIPLGGRQTYNCSNMKGRSVNLILRGKTGYLTLCEIQIYGVPVTEGDRIANKNLALYGRATHSTNVNALSSALNVIDGNTDPIYSQGSCFSSANQLSPWFRVDLLATYEISHIMVTNRGDCCAQYINGVEILVGDSLANNGNNNPRCVQITSIPLSGTNTFRCPNMKGRYVNLILRGKTGYLTFCEIQVYGTPVPNDEHFVCLRKDNLALQGRATQSSTFEFLSLGMNAIDGNADPIFGSRSCFSSKNELSPWWRVDLLASYKISHIMITNRGDCCAEYINGAEILIGDSLTNNGNNNARCAQITAIPLGTTLTFHCFDMKGRYVNIVLPGKTTYLSFCEVQIYGTPVSECSAC
ncbi:uncharacterized protein LOC143988082 [Lithobates pipiens]